MFICQEYKLVSIIIIIAHSYIIAKETSNGLYSSGLFSTMALPRKFSCERIVYFQFQPQKFSLQMFCPILLIAYK